MFCIILLAFEYLGLIRRPDHLSPYYWYFSVRCTSWPHRTCAVPDSSRRQTSRQPWGLSEFWCTCDLWRWWLWRLPFRQHLGGCWAWRFHKPPAFVANLAGNHLTRLNCDNKPSIFDGCTKSSSVEVCIVKLTVFLNITNEAGLEYNSFTEQFQS